MGRSPCCAKEGMNRGAWTALEDKILTDYIKSHGEGRWRNLPNNAGLKRCGKSCRLRWLNYLRPDIKRGNISSDEEDLIIRLHKLLGNRWSLIAGRLPGRTDNEIKNYWNTNLVKKVQLNQHHHQNSPPEPAHSNHDRNKNKPTIEPASMNEPPILVHTMASRSTKPIDNIMENSVPQKVDQDDNVPMHRDISVDDLVDYGCEDAAPENLMMNLTNGFFRLSDFLSSEFSDFCDFNIKNVNVVDDNNNSNRSSSSPSPSPLPKPSSDHQAGPSFSDEMLEDWALCDQNVDSDNLKYFSTLLDTEVGDWL